MRKKAFCIGWFLFLMALVLEGGRQATGEENPIFSILKRGDNVLVSTRTYLYEASLGEKKWQVLYRDLPPCGKLVQQAPENPFLLYYQPAAAEMPELLPKPADGDLFCSENAGKAWAKVASGHLFTEVFIHSNGWIFAVEKVDLPQPPTAGGYLYSTKDKEQRDIYCVNQLLVSQDKGKTWRDISTNLPRGLALHGFFEDPDHPGQVCLGGSRPSHLSAPVVFQADPISGEWKKEARGQWHDGLLTEKDFVQNDSRSGRMAMTSVGLSLSNFFMDPAPDSRGSGFVDLVQVGVEKQRYTFGRDEPKVIVVRVAFVTESPALTLRDNEDETVFWGAEVLPKGGALTCIPPRNLELTVASPDAGRKEAAYLGDPRLRKVTLDYAHPFRREIDLSKFYDFSKPGAYKVKVRYGDVLPGEAGGSAGSRAFDVVVEP